MPRFPVGSQVVVTNRVQPFLLEGEEERLVEKIGVITGYTRQRVHIKLFIGRGQDDRPIWRSPRNVRLLTRQEKLGLSRGARENIDSDSERAVYFRSLRRRGFRLT